MIKPDLNLEAQLKQYAQEAVSSFSKGDVIAYTSSSQSISFEFDRLHSIEDVSHTVLSCRVFDQDKAGVAFVNDPKQWQQAKINALESARFGEEISFELPKAATVPEIPGRYSERNCLYSKEELKDMGASLTANLKKEAPKAKITVGLDIEYYYGLLANSQGFFDQEKRSSLSVYGGVFELDKEGSFIELYEAERFFSDEPNFSLITQPLLERLDWSRRVVSLKTGALPVIFAPSAMGILIEPLLMAINGKVLNKGLSVLRDKQGAQVVSPKFSLSDQPLRPKGNSYRFDDEGTPAQTLSLFEDGIFRNFIYDCANAAKQHTQSTGHGERGGASLPSPSFSNVCLQAGKKSFNELLHSVDCGLLLFEGLGEGQSNVLAGDFSILASSAFLVQQGVIKGRVKDVMLSGNAYDALNRIQEISDKEIQEGGLFSPYVLIDGIAVSGHKGG